MAALQVLACVSRPARLGAPQARRPCVPSSRLAARPRLHCKAAGGEGGAGSPPPGALTLSQAFEALGLAEGASYEEVLSAKNRLLDKYGEDFERRMEVEAAYDLIFSSRLRARLDGNLPVSSNVRFADVQQRRKRPAASGGAAPGFAGATSQKAQQLLQGISSSGGVEVAAPPPRTAAAAAGVYGALAAWTLAQGLLEPSPASAAADVPGVQLALGVAAAVYLLREQKRVGLGKAVALSMVGLIAGICLGSAVQSWLRVDVIPLGPLGSPGALVGEFGIAGLAAVALFLA